MGRLFFIRLFIKTNLLGSQLHTYTNLSVCIRWALTAYANKFILSFQSGNWNPLCADILSMYTYYSYTIFYAIVDKSDIDWLDGMFIIIPHYSVLRGFTNDNIMISIFVFYNYPHSTFDLLKFIPNHMPYIACILNTETKSAATSQQHQTTLL